MKDLAIVVVAYNRAASLERLLHSLAGVYGTDRDIPLVISIDKGDNTDVVSVAERFVWEPGEKRVLCREENMGLKKHVLSCAALAGEYGNIIMLEDDLLVSPRFYEYAKAALAFTKGREDIGGISLYNHLFNVHVREPFEAVDDGYDNWYFQIASSWGQAWSAAQWSAFAAWLKEHGEEPVAAENVPENISSWSDKSWLKLYTKYLIDTDRYFIYPRISLTTNFSDAGAHSRRTETDLQVPLAGAGVRPYVFSTPEQSGAVYDAFFENTRLAAGLGLKETELDVDLYGYKRLSRRYVLTSRVLDCKVVTSFGCSLRPMDANILYQMEGDDFRLYDRQLPDRPAGKESSRILYHYKGFKVKYMLPILLQRLRERQK